MTYQTDKHISVWSGNHLLHPFIEFVAIQANAASNYPLQLDSGLALVIVVNLLSQVVEILPLQKGYQLSLLLITRVVSHINAKQVNMLSCRFIKLFYA